MSPILIIGAGQAGLATAYHLQQRGLACTLVDAHARIGDNWRTRWDSLRLFSPARYSSLDGWALPCPPRHLPSKDEVADYLEAYAQRFGFATLLGTRVEAVTQVADGFAVTLVTAGERTIVHAKTVIVAAGAFDKPYVPTFGEAAGAGIFQIHVAAYHNPGLLPDGPALVVGTGASGTQVAAELSASRKVYLSGPATKHAPRSFLGRDLYWWLYALGIMRIRRESWLGRKLLQRPGGGDLLVGPSLAAIVATAGLQRRGMLVGFKDGLPQFDDGQSADDIRSVVWATGYRNDYRWLPAPACDADGIPLQRRGIALAVPGLYFVGLRFMYRADSSNLGGVARDAEYLAQVVADRR